VWSQAVWNAVDKSYQDSLSSSLLSCANSFLSYSDHLAVQLSNSYALGKIWN